MADSNNHNPNHHNNKSKHEDPSPASFMEIDGSEEDKILAKSEYLTREEVIKRRYRRTKQLQRCYIDHYWALMEELRARYRKYYWIYGRSPYKEDEEREEEANGGVGTVGEDHDNHSNNNNNNINGNGNSTLGFERCAFAGCKTKAMALTRFCHTHILSDTKQMLYKRCTYVVKSASTPITCGKPILKSTVPASCPLHLQNAEKHVTRALKKAGLNVSSSSKLAPKCHVVVAEYVRQIQTKRRAAHKGAVDKVQNKEEDTKVEVKEEDTS